MRSFRFGVCDVKGELEAVVTSSLPGTHDLITLNQRPRVATVPPYTQYTASFVVPALSSSDHEVTSNNAFLSGTRALEISPVPASGNIYYSKQSRFVNLTYRLTASSGLAVTPANVQTPSNIEVKRGTNLFQAVSGSYRNNGIYQPSVFEIEVPDYGLIRDVKVWVELIHDIRGGTGAIASGSPFFNDGDGAAAGLNQGLQGLQIALRSPNTSFRAAHPLWNDPTVVGLKKDVASNTRPAVPEIYQNSYLLWAGHQCETDLGVTLGALTASNFIGAFSESLGSHATNTTAAASPSIQADRSSRPVIVWVTGSSDSLYIRRPFMNGTTVAFATEVAFPVTSPYGVTLLLGKDRVTPYVVLGDNTNFNLKYALSGHDFGWRVDTVKSRIPLSPGNHYGNSDFALDGQDKSVIFSRDDNLNIVSFVSSSTAGWVETKVGNSSRTERSAPSVAADTDDVFHFAFLDRDITGARWLYYGMTGSAGQLGPDPILRADWTSLTDSDDTLSLAVDRGNVPTVVIVGGSLFNGVKVVRSGAAGWTVQTVLSDISLADASTQIGPKGAKFDPSGNLLAIFELRNYRGTGVTKSGLFRSGSNGLSFEFVEGRNLFTFGANSMDVDGTGVVHSVVRDIGASSLEGVLYYFRRNFTSGSDQAYYEYDTDIDMRTVFTDASRVQNPRHLQAVYGLGGSGQQSERLRNASSYPSPLSSSISMFNYLYFEPSFLQSTFLTGANFPWMLDPRILPGNFTNRNYSLTASLGSSPPPGWITGPGGVAAVNEFPTTGSQIGPADIRPVYPLLDDVYVEQDVVLPSQTSFPTVLGQGKKIAGFRPGLRGTEIHGKWKLLIGNISGSTTGSTERGGYWFRQFRLEFLVDQHQGIRWDFPSRDRKFSKVSQVPTVPGYEQISILSGSSAWDIGTNHVLLKHEEEYGRSVGITDLTGSSSFAVFSQLTGALVDLLSGSGQLAAVRSSYLMNEFGTPYIPISVGSAVIPSFSPFSPEDVAEAKKVFSETLDPRTLVPKDNTLTAHVVRSRVLQTTRDAILEKIKKS